MHMAEISVPFDPKNFTGGPITNEFMPLAVGNTWFYKISDGTIDTVKVTDQTITIDGVQCVVVSDVAQEVNKNGIATKVTETTNDYFAQDKAGNVWYFGEDTKAFEAGGATTEGTWRAGEIPEGGTTLAQPGIIMLADPRKGDSYFEEQAPPVAVDRAAVTSLNASADVPFGTFNKDCLQTSNTSATPGDVESKFYAPGIGSVLELDADGTRQELVSFTNSGTSLVQAMASFGGQSSLAPASPSQKEEHAHLAEITASPHSHHG
jgi:hypothetical protein